MNIDSWDELVEAEVRKLPEWHKKARALNAVLVANYDWVNLLQALAENSVILRSHVMAEDLSSSDYHKVQDVLDMVSECAIIINEEWERVAMRNLEARQNV